jgi:predicted amidophosphoribosyltransferase
MSLLQYVLSPQCISCSSFLVRKHLYCDVCYNFIIKPIVKKLNVRQTERGNHHHYLFSWGADSDPSLDVLIYRLKKNYSLLAWAHYAAVIVSLKPIEFWQSFDAIAYIPSSRAKADQAQFFAEQLGLLLKKPISALLSRRPLETEQKKLSRTMRQQSKKFDWCCLKNVEFTKILIIDDILTTGSSFNECLQLVSRNTKHLVEVDVLTLMFREPPT